MNLGTQATGCLAGEGNPTIRKIQSVLGVEADVKSQEALNDSLVLQTRFGNMQASVWSIPGDDAAGTVIARPAGTPAPQGKK